MHIRNFIKKENLYIFLIYLVVLASVYGLFLNQTLVCDLVQVSSLNENSTVTYGPWTAQSFFQTLVGERPMDALYNAFNYYVLYRLFGVSYLSYQWVYQLGNILIFALDATILFHLFGKYISEKLKPLLAACLLIGFINPAFVQMLLFPFLSWSLAILWCVLALSFFEGRHYIIAGIFVWMSAGSYQSWYATFVVFVLLFVFLSNKGQICKASIKQTLVAVAVTAIPLFLLIIVPKIAIQATVIEATDVAKPVVVSVQTDFLSKVFGRIPTAFMGLINTSYGYVKYGTIKYFLIILLMLTLVCLIIRKRIKDVLIFVLLGLFTMFVPFAFGLVSEGMPYGLRRMASFYMAISVLTFIECVYITNWGDEKLRVKNVRQFGLLTLIVFYLVIVTKGTETGISDIITANKVEMQTCREIKKEIDRYEEEMGQPVELIKVAKYKDGRAAFDNTYMNVVYDTQYSIHQVLEYEWADVSLINLLFGTSYQRDDATEEEMEKYFGQIKDKYDSLRAFSADEQIVFDGNTMYWLLY